MKEPEIDHAVEAAEAIRELLVEYGKAIGHVMVLPSDMVQVHTAIIRSAIEKEKQADLDLAIREAAQPPQGHQNE